MLGLLLDEDFIFGLDSVVYFYVSCLFSVSDDDGDEHIRSYDRTQLPTHGTIGLTM
jgi:hypothetical protein